MATCIKRGRSSMSLLLINPAGQSGKELRSSMSLLLINPAGQSGKELSLNGDISITNSTTKMSNAFNDHFSTIIA